MIQLRFVDDGADVTFSALTLMRGLEAAHGQVSFSTFEDLARRADDEIEVVEGADQRFRGYLEITEGSAIEGFDGSARSRVIQLERFDARSREQFRQTTTAAIARSLASTAGAEVGQLVERPVNRFRLSRGESFRAALQRLGEAHQLVVTDDAAGRLRLFALAADPVPVATWVDGQGTVTGAMSRRIDFSGWRREWECRGQRLLVAADINEEDDQISIGTIAGTTRASRRVLGNKAATSRADASDLIDWAAKKALASVASVTVEHNEWPGEPGDVVRVQSRFLGVDDIMIIATVEVDFVARSYRAHCALPDVYRERVRLAAQRVQRVRTWEPE